MTLFFSLLPLYLLGNFHCIGMCGPLVMMIGKNKYRSFYFFGRTLAFALAGLFAGLLGAVTGVILAEQQLSSWISIIAGSAFLIFGCANLMQIRVTIPLWLRRKIAHTTQPLSLLMLRDTPWSSFLFGFFTILLPCGQTLLVFSACAIYGDPILGFLNGFAFALLTSFSLYIAMNFHKIPWAKRLNPNSVTGLCALIVGSLTICRGLAEAGWMSHLILNPSSPNLYHIVLF